MTDTRPETRPRPVHTDTGDHERLSHYVLGRDPKARITSAMVEGKPIRALCGKRWIPSRDPSRYPVCPECKKIKEQLLRQE